MGSFLRKSTILPFFLISSDRFDQFSWILPQSDQLTWKWFQEEEFWVWGQITNLGSFRVKFLKSLKVGKLYIKMTLLTSAFQKKGSRGQQRSPEVKNSEKRSIFKSLWKWVNCIWKWRSWRKLFKKRDHEVNKGHPRSKIPKKGKFWTSVINDKLYIKMTVWTSAF